MANKNLEVGADMADNAESDLNGSSSDENGDYCPASLAKSCKVRNRVIVPVIIAFLLVLGAFAGVLSL